MADALVDGGTSGKLLIATVGLPRAGKSWWAQRQNVPVVCPDAIRLALHGQRYAAEAEPFVWAIAKIMTRALFASGSRVVILDATNMTRKRRDEWRSPEWETRFKIFCTTAARCKQRAILANQEDLLPVIDRMVAEGEPLGEDELLWGESDVPPVARGGQS